MSLHFVWGAGGVGKSHFVLRKAFETSKESSPVIMTLDPSQRLYYLLALQPGTAARMHYENPMWSCYLQATEIDRLFDDLHSRQPAQPSVRLFYQQMVNGLQEFRDYLALIQLADQLSHRGSEAWIIDTPPFHEAQGLHRSALRLKTFFGTQVVQWGVKTSRLSLIQASLKKIMEITRIFVGKKAASQVFDFIQWLSLHSDRFVRAAENLEEILFSDSTTHTLILTSETPISQIDEMNNFFKKAHGPLKVIMNRSAQDFPADPDSQDPFVREWTQKKQQEDQLVKALPPLMRDITYFPVLVMGEDSPEELERFLREPYLEINDQGSFSERDLGR
jgi:anion-transporting  ArsA/GET3 family ATPase